MYGVCLLKMTSEGGGREEGRGKREEGGGHGHELQSGSGESTRARVGGWHIIFLFFFLFCPALLANGRLGRARPSFMDMEMDMERDVEIDGHRDDCGEWVTFVLLPAYSQSIPSLQPWTLFLFVVPAFLATVFLLHIYLPAYVFACPFLHLEPHIHVPATSRPTLPTLAASMRGS